MIAHIDDFCKGIAMVLQGESLKAKCYVTHNSSLGQLREKIVSRFVRHETPEKYRVETGLVRHHDAGITSRQCDLLVHDPGKASPIYRWEDFVVVRHFAAQAVLEVKSNLYKDEFKELVIVHGSLIAMSGSIPIPTFGYGLTGATFNTCVEYVKDAVNNNLLNLANDQKHLNWPNCFVIQDTHCIGIRPMEQGSSKPLSFCLVDLAQADDTSYGVDGIETGFFLQIYTASLEDRRRAFGEGTVYQWFNQLPISPEGKAWVTPDGTVHKGNIE
jgi:hypothetical protein